MAACAWKILIGPGLNVHFLLRLNSLLYIVRMGISYNQIRDRIQFICTPEFSNCRSAHIRIRISRCPKNSGVNVAEVGLLIVILTKIHVANNQNIRIIGFMGAIN